VINLNLDKVYLLFNTVDYNFFGFFVFLDHKESTTNKDVTSLLMVKLESSISFCFADFETRLKKSNIMLSF